MAMASPLHSYDCRMKKVFTAERVEQLKQLSKTHDIYERLSRALGELISLEMSSPYSPFPSSSSSSLFRSSSSSSSLL